MSTSAGVRVGVLMQRWPGADRPFGPLTPFAQTLATLGRSRGAEVLCFGPAEVDLKRRRVWAHRYLGPERGWAQVQDGLPRVVWNRYFKRDQVEGVEQLRRAGVVFLNPVGLDKWEAYRCLAGDPEVAPHLPETHLLVDPYEVTAMLSRYPTVFLKPVRGSVGRGIVVVRRTDGDLMRLQYISTETHGLREVFATAWQLGRWLEQDRAGRYVAQQGLDLAIFHGRPCDVRVLVQKDGNGCWGITGMGARVAAHGRFTANLHTGGQGVPVELLAEAVCPDAADQQALLAQLEGLAMRVVRRLEEAAGPMGEVGVDFGVDARGQTWIIEQNAQPGRAIFTHMGRPDLSDLAHLRPLEYALHLHRKLDRKVDQVST
jgi:hypothetical protein